MTSQLVSSAPVPLDMLTDPAAAAAAWARSLHRTGLSASSKRSYETQVRAHLTWLADQGRHDVVEAFTDPHIRDYAVRHYKQWMLRVKKSSGKWFDTALSGIGNFYDWLGLGKPHVTPAVGRRRNEPKALSDGEVRDGMRAAERRGPRDLAIYATLVGTGVRIEELWALDLIDVWITARKGAIDVVGKGDKTRTIPLNRQCRDALARWQADRASWPGAETPALFLSRGGRRLSIRSIRHLVAEIGDQIGIELSPHMLRHTFGTILARKNVDVERIRELMGHASVETTSVYTRSTRESAAEAVELIHIDY